MSGESERPLSEERRTLNENQAFFAGPRMGGKSVNKLVFIAIWLVFLGQPAGDLLHGDHSLVATALGWVGFIGFVVLYLAMFRRIGHIPNPWTVWIALPALFVLALVLAFALGSPWYELNIYVAVSCGAVLPLAYSRWAILAVCGVLFGLGLQRGHGVDYGLVLPGLVGGFAMAGVRQLVLTTVELRRARATVAQLAANEERLRLARDLHDLLGHSLSLITLKSELAGRMLPGQPEKAAQQIQDIEQVSRQALVDVREAVSGYRRPRLSGELAAAEMALTAARITADVAALSVGPDGGLDLPESLTEERESALAWAVREAVTNVVRHSGARTCTVTLDARQTLDGHHLELAVRDDGAGGSGGHGNGLTGLTERLTAVGGALAAAPGRKGGFLLLARVPLGPGTTGPGPVGSAA